MNINKVSGTNLMSLKSILHFADFDVYLGPGNTDIVRIVDSIVFQLIYFCYFYYHFYLSIYLPICLSIYLSTYPSACLPACQSVYLSMCTVNILCYILVLVGPEYSFFAKLKITQQLFLCY